jgi:hypothetical protein
LRPDGGAEAFEELIQALAGENPIVKDMLVSWQSYCQRLREEDPLPLAHEFARATAKLFYHAAWVRISEKAEHHPEPEWISQLADTVLSS